MKLASTCQPDVSQTAINVVRDFLSAQPAPTKGEWLRLQRSAQVHGAPASFCPPDPICCRNNSPRDQYCHVCPCILFPDVPHHRKGRNVCCELCSPQPGRHCGFKDTDSRTTLTPVSVVKLGGGARCSDR